MSNAKRGRPFEASPKFAMPTDLLGYNIVRLAHMKRTRDDAIFKAHLGIGLSQFGALMMLRDMPGMGAGQLARWLLITPQSTAVQLAELERMQLIERESGRRRRGTRVKLHITKHGNSIIERGQSVLSQTEAEVRCGLSAAEAQTFNRLLLRVAEAYTNLHRTSKRHDTSQKTFQPTSGDICRAPAVARTKAGARRPPRSGALRARP